MRTASNCHLSATVTIGDEEHDADVVYSYTPGTRATGPTWNCGGEPGDPPEVEIEAVIVDDDRDVLDELSDAGVRELEELALEQGGDYD